MAESTLSLSLTDLEAEVGFFLGWGRGVNFGETAWTTTKQQGITNCVKSGLRAFYFPSPLPSETESYDWSFMRPIRQVLLASQLRYADMPDDFGGLEGDIRLIDSGRRAIPIQITNDQQISQRFFAYPTQTGVPEMVSIQSDGRTSQTKGNRSRLYVFPMADQDYTLEFQYYFLPDSLTVSFPYPHGGTVHAETILAACIAKAELYQDNQLGPMAANFLDQMKKSVSLDRRNKAQTLGYNSDPGYNRGRFPYGYRHYDSVNPITYGGVVPG